MRKMLHLPTDSIHNNPLVAGHAHFDQGFPRRLASLGSLRQGFAACGDCGRGRGRGPHSLRRLGRSGMRFGGA